jgi:general secretion pathway protein J
MTIRSRGFTLIEILVALAIMALLAVLGYRALASLTDSEAQLTAEASRWRTLDMVFARLEADLRGALPRGVRTGSGTEPAWFAGIDAQGNAELRITRAGPEFEPEPGSAGQRIGYRLREGTLEVMYWPHADVAPGTAPAVYSLCGGVASFRVGYLDSAGGWRERWPALGEAPVPRAVSVVLTLADGTVIDRQMVLR